MRLFDEQRGRPRGRSNPNYRVLESMVWIASKYDLDPALLADALFEAFEKEVSHYGGLEISCRKVNQTSTVFLITNGEKVLWQFPINLEMTSSAEFRARIKELPMPVKVKTDGTERNRSIGELRFGMKGVNVTATIIDIPPTRAVITRWGSEAFVSSVKMDDTTGSIRLSLWNNQIKMVNIGDEVEVTNCRVTRFANNTQLQLGRNSTISILNQPQQDVLIQEPLGK